MSSQTSDKPALTVTQRLRPSRTTSLASRGREQARSDQQDHTRGSQGGSDDQYKARDTEAVEAYSLT
ncbi:MAG TPA: hypothetical protein DC047_18135 [Blastocatellia bacterium]|nr:hypothetical protein [Blastocatellia bacterium]